MSAQSQHEGLCLRYPEVMGPQPSLSFEAAVTMLLRATQLAQHTPFQWGYIDKPSEGQMFLIFLTPQLPFPSDGIRYQEQEQKANLQAGPGREVEFMEVKYGFVPGQDTTAWRVRRRFRMQKGGHPQLVLIHYGRGQPTPIIQSLNQPVRSYPLRPINEPAVFVMGDKVGQKVYPSTNPAMGDRQQASMMGIGFGAGMAGSAQALLAQQNSNLEALERRTRERSASMNTRQPPPQTRVDDDDSADESDMISTRTLALTRYRRNHEFMNEVFMFAAFGRQKEFEVPPPPLSIFDKSALDEKVAKLTVEVEELKAKAAARHEARLSAEAGVVASDDLADMSVDSVGVIDGAVMA